MNCSNWEERIALYAGGDLRPEEAVEVERHLGDCPGCQVFASGLKESLQLLQEVHTEPIAPAHFSAVRARVMAELESAQLPWWKRQMWIYGLAVAALALVFLLARSPQAPVAPHQMAVHVPPVPVEPHVVGTPAPEPVVPRIHHAQLRRHSPAARPRIVPARENTESGPPVVVKLVTADPNVIIYWITDNSGESR
jgi:anti-sigma factor RsiW